MATLLTSVQRSTLLLALLLSTTLLSTAGVDAHNGRLAMGLPLDDITVDGDLSDWPEDLPRYAITMAEFGKPPSGPQDFAADFRVGYSPTTHRIYVAVEVVDESTVLHRKGRSNWDNADGCDLYIGLEHESYGGPVAQLAMWGNDRHAMGAASLRSFEVATTERPKGRVYEWSVDADAFQSKPLHDGFDLAFDIVVADVDEDGSFSWMAWGARSSKLASPMRLGDVMLVGAGADLEDAMDSAGEMIQRTTGRADSQARTMTSYLALLSGSLLAVSLLHLLLYGFQRESRTNLYYAIYTACTAAAVFASFQVTVPPIVELLTFTQNSSLGAVGAGIFGFILLVYGSSLLFLYAFFYEKTPVFGRIILFTMAALPLCAAFGYLTKTFLGSGAGPQIGNFLVGTATVGLPLMAVAMLIEIPRIVLAAVVRRKSGAWSVGVGFLVFAVCGLVVIYNLLSRQPIEPMILLGVVLPLGTMSFRLARSVATVHSDLAERYAQVEALSEQLREQNRALEMANIQIREQSLQVSEANRLKSDFLARMSHDLRTPLNAIIGYTRILLRRLKDEVEPRQYQNLGNVRVSADNLLALINDILDLSRIESGRNEVHIDAVDVTQLISECGASLQSLVSGDVQFTLDVAPDLPTIQSDADRVRRVLMNLAGNAIKYTEAGQITIAARHDGEHILLQVTDTGLGIPADDLPYIFDEFRQVDRNDRKREGSGLGLAIARKSVEMLGGQIEVTSREAEGSTFSVRLPLQTSGVKP
ncbi:MAG: hypothetical protein HN712_28290 [Gemmatimonadetes bacterium]|nr:hypothetical protein [Gemmatimonadota bacterium]MBT6147603.1 hypothetical protein [Gemmatimonadota bacterium]MBT7864244.1 hypothetical protein [Gemmatimonadota bacterium]